MHGEGGAISVRVPAAASARRGAAVALALLAGACWYPKERGDRLEQRMDQIEGERPADRSGDAAALRAELKRVEANLADVQAKLQSVSASSKPGAEPTAQQTELTAEVGRLRASVEQYGRRLDAVERSVAQSSSRAAQGERVAERGPTPQQKQGRREAPPSPTPAPQPKAAPPAASAGTGASAATGAATTSALALAREQEQKGQKAVARELYQQYAAENPTDPASAEAHFRLGELAYGEKKYNDAILEYGKVAREFPKSDRAPDALLRTADSMAALGMKDDAAAVLAQVPQRYPGSPAATRAKKRLAELR